MKRPPPLDMPAAPRRRHLSEDERALWEKLSAGGRTNRCGWLQDKFGISWQIVPAVLGRLLSDSDPAKANRVMKAMLQMEKLDIRGLQEAYEDKAASARQGD